MSLERTALEVLPAAEYRNDPYQRRFLNSETCHGLDAGSRRAENHSLWLQCIRIWWPTMSASETSLTENSAKSTKGRALRVEPRVYMPE